MKFCFFEEFPSDENMNKLKLIKFPVKVFVAARSFDEFNKISKRYSQKNISFGFWPILKVSDGYWFSPFVSLKVLKKSLADASRASLVLIDLERPRNSWLLFNVIMFFRKKRLLQKFISGHNEVYTAEYATTRLKWLGLSSKVHARHKVGKMVYSKRIPFDTSFVIRSLKESYGKNLVIYLGCIAQGINGNEAILSPSGLAHDLFVCKENNIGEVGIFRLGGLNKEYIKIIESFN